MTSVAIPEVKDTLRSLTVDRCTDAVRAAINETGDAVSSRALLQDRLGLG